MNGGITMKFKAFFRFLGALIIKLVRLYRRKDINIDVDGDGDIDITIYSRNRENDSQEED